MSKKTRKHIGPVSLVMALAIIGALAAFLVLATNPGASQAQPAPPPDPRCRVRTHDVGFPCQFGDRLSGGNALRSSAAADHAADAAAEQRPRRHRQTAAPAPAPRSRSTLRLPARCATSRWSPMRTAPRRKSY